MLAKDDYSVNTYKYLIPINEGMDDERKYMYFFERKILPNIKHY